MRHLLMNPHFPDIVGELAQERIDDRARVWTVTRGEDGMLEERLDTAALADTLLIAVALQEIAENRAW